MEYIDLHLRHCRHQRLATRTITARGKLLRRVDQALPYGLMGAGAEEIADWLTQPAPGRAGRPPKPRSNQTIATYRMHLAGFYCYWSDPRRTPHLDWNPMEDVPAVKVPQGRPRPVSEETLAYALTYLPAWSVLAVRLAAQAGFRCCEMAAATRADFDPDEIVVHGKGGTTKTVACHPDIWGAVRDLPPGPIFTARRGGPVTAHYMTCRLSEDLAKVGLVGVTAHRFRHRFGSRVNEYVDTRTAQEFLRHEHLTSTARYTAVGRNQRAAAIRALAVMPAAS